MSMNHSRIRDNGKVRELNIPCPVGTLANNTIETFQVAEVRVG